MAVDYSQGTYYGGGGLLAFSAEGQKAVPHSSGGSSGLGGMFKSGLSGALTGGSVGGPPGAIVGGALGLIGKGVSAWLNSKEKDEAKAEADKRYKERMRINQEHWEAQMDMDRKRFGLTKVQVLQNWKQNREKQKNYYNERNEQRANASTNKMMNLINQPEFKSKFEQTWGGR